MSTRREFIQVLSAAGAAFFIQSPVSASKDNFDIKKLPMMPIRDVVIFPYMMRPFVVGRESSVHALEEALAADKKIFLATQHDASIDEPKPNEIYQVGTVVNIVQSLKLPDGNIKVLVEGIERGKILQVTETEGFMQASVRLARYATETNPQIEAGMQRVTGLFEQYVKLCQSLNYETMIAAVRMEDPAKLTDIIAANLPLSIAEKQGLLEIFDPAERLSRVGDLLEIAIKQEPETDPIQCLPMGTIEGTLYIRWENGTQASATPRYKLMFSRYKDLSKGVHITSREGLYNLLVNYRSGGIWSPKGGAQPSKLLVGSDGLESYLIDIGFRPDDAKDWIKQIHEKGSVSIPNVMMPEEQMSEYER